MPGGDRTGPMGAGAMTGRAMGLCAGAGAPGYMNAGGGRGFGLGRGRGGGRGPSAGLGAGWRNMFFATGQPGWMRGGWGGVMPPAPAPEQELAALKQQADYFGHALEEIRGRIQELEAKPADK
ncbi:MAG: DUF5320 domain-containing protein [Verrucomicrobia bacterium]|nr:DUF5320 domain-containing protein [Verrucomicrobiota bacterium]